MVGRNVYVRLDEGKLPGAEVVVGPSVVTGARPLFHRKPASREMSQAYRPRRTASLKNRAGKNGDHV